jgi:putative intracellular protease/amidase
VLEEEKDMNRKMLLLARAVVYLLAFVVPPVLVGVVGVKAALSDRYEEPPAEARAQAGELPAPPGHDPDKPTAVVLLSNEGSEVTDVLAPYEVLSESGAFNVYTAAPEREVATLSGGLDVLPQLSFAELDRRLEDGDPDVVVVPAMWDVGTPAHRPVAEWLKQHAEGTGTVMSVCDGGAEVLADAGPLDGWPFARLLRPLAVGLLGLVAVAALDHLVLTPAAKALRRPPPKGTGA